MRSGQRQDQRDSREGEGSWPGGLRRAQADNRWPIHLGVSVGLGRRQTLLPFLAFVLHTFDSMHRQPHWLFSDPSPLSLSEVSLCLLWTRKV